MSYSRAVVDAIIDSNVTISNIWLSTCHPYCVDRNQGSVEVGLSLSGPTRCDSREKSWFFNFYGLCRIGHRYIDWFLICIKDLLAPWPPMGVLSMGLDHCHKGNILRYFTNFWVSEKCYRPNLVFFYLETTTVSSESQTGWYLRVGYGLLR